MTEEQKAMPEEQLEEEQKAMPEEQLEEFISIRNQFMPLYSKTGLISIESCDGILLRADMFIETFPNHETKPFECEGSVYTEEIFAFYNGVKFYAIR